MNPQRRAKIRQLIQSIIRNSVAARLRSVYLVSPRLGTRGMMQTRFLKAMDKERQEKPIRTLLQDVHSNAEISRLRPQGFVALKTVDRITFFASLLALVLIAGGMLAMIWDFVELIRGLRFIGSVIVVFFTLLVFRAINSQFN